MICPFMSRPIVYSTVEDEGDQRWGLYPTQCRENDCVAWVPEQPCRGGPFCLVPTRTGNMPCETCCYAGEKTIPAHCKLIGVK